MEDAKLMDMIKRFIFNIEEIISGFFISITVVVVIANVILRYFFNTALYWAEEVATICFVWSVFVGASATYKHKMNLGIDILITKGTPLTQDIVKTIVNIILLIINMYIFYLSIIFTNASKIKPTAVLGVSSMYVNSALVVGFALLTFHSIRFFIKDFIDLLKVIRKKEVN